MLSLVKLAADKKTLSKEKVSGRPVRENGHLLPKLFFQELFNVVVFEVAVSLVVVDWDGGFSQRVFLREIQIDVVAVFGGKNQPQNRHFPLWRKPVLFDDVHERVGLKLDD